MTALEFDMRDCQFPFRPQPLMAWSKVECFNWSRPLYGRRHVVADGIPRKHL